MPRRVNLFMCVSSRALDLCWIAHVDWAQVHADRRRHRLDDGKLAGPGGYLGIAQHRHSYAEQLKPGNQRLTDFIKSKGGLKQRRIRLIECAAMSRETPAANGK